MTGDGGYSYAWNGEGLLKSAGSTTYTYDGDDKRVEKSSGTYYWFSPSGSVLAETDTGGGTQNEYIYFNGGRTARRDSSGKVYYYFQDQIGTSRLIANSSGTVCYDADYTPFGYEMAYTTTCSQNYKFTGMERDAETGNDHAWFRNYEQNLGRWLSPDPLGGDITNPQSLNRYAYVMNNPTTFIDPLGLLLPVLPCDDVFDPECAGGDEGGGDYWGDQFGPSINICPDPLDLTCFTFYLPILPPIFGGGGWGGGGGGGVGGNAGGTGEAPNDWGAESLLSSGCIQPSFFTSLSIFAAKWTARTLYALNGQTLSVSYGVGASAGVGGVIGATGSASSVDTVDISGNAAQVTTYEVGPALPGGGAGGVAGIQVGDANSTVPTTPQASGGWVFDSTISLGGGTGWGGSIARSRSTGATTITGGYGLGGWALSTSLLPVYVATTSKPYCGAGKLW
jgi:RHS repeat-associated protein